MANYTAADVKRLRELTGAGMLDCKNAKNAEFQKLADDIVAAAVASKAADVDTLKAAKIGDNIVEQAIADLSAKIGEKLELRRVAFFDGTVETYLHKRAADLPPAVGVLVEYQGSDKDAAHAAALQIAALKAKYLSRDDVPADVVANERRIAEETAKSEGKPEKALPKIVEGRLNGFFKDVVLLEQPSVSDNKKTVKALLDEAGVTVTRFARFEVGQP
jgi:elongation factor Ts